MHFMAVKNGEDVLSLACEQQTHFRYKTTSHPHPNPHPHLPGIRTKIDYRFL